MQKLVHWLWVSFTFIVTLVITSQPAHALRYICSDLAGCERMIAIDRAGERAGYLSFLLLIVFTFYIHRLFHYSRQFELTINVRFFNPDELLFHPLSIFIIYAFSFGYIAIFFMSFARRGLISPNLAAWIPNLLLFAICVYLYRISAIATQPNGYKK